MREREHDAAIGEETVNDIDPKIAALVKALAAAKKMSGKTPPAPCKHLVPPNADGHCPKCLEGEKE